MAQVANTRNVGDWLLAYLQRAGIPTTLGLASMDWGRLRAGEPVYPVNAVTDCPRLDLYIDEAKPQPWAAGQSVVNTAWSLWYKRRQVPAQAGATPVNHHLLLVQDVETIINLFLGRWQPTEIMGHENVKVYGVYFGTIRYVEDLRHDIDTPSLRISAAEIPLAVEARVIG